MDFMPLRTKLRELGISEIFWPKKEQLQKRKDNERAKVAAQEASVWVHQLEESVADHAYEPGMPASSIFTDEQFMEINDYAEFQTSWTESKLSTLTNVPASVHFSKRVIQT
eukprot:6658098-Karenia_brevis.AAC.1